VEEFSITFQTNMIRQTKTLNTSWSGSVELVHGDYLIGPTSKDSFAENADNR